MKGNELVWRTLVDGAVSGNRTWRNVGDLAFAAGVPASTAYLALERLESNGSIDRYRGGGLAVVSVEKVLTMLCAWRNLKRDTIVMTTRAAIEPFLTDDQRPYALGGPDAANVHLKGRAVSDFHEHIVYLPDSLTLRELPEGSEVRVLAMDKRAMKMWQGYSSIAQTYADLFASPGWQASEFRKALGDEYFSGREWVEGGVRR